MRPTPVSVEFVRPLRREVLRPGRSDDELVFPGDDEPETLHTAIVLGRCVVGIATVMRDPHPHEPASGDWRVRGMATSPFIRGHGIGAALLAACEAHARDRAARRLWCNARVDARSFYERAGFDLEGDEYVIPDVGPHYLMSKRFS